MTPADFQPMHLQPPRLGPRVTRASLLAVVALVAAAATSTARADFVVAEEGPQGAWDHRSLALTGVLQPGFIWRANDRNAPLSDDAFVLTRARIGLRAQLHRYVFARLELETTPSAALTDAYVDVRPSQALAVRMGQFQIGFLRTFLQDESNLAFIDRPLYTPFGQDRPALRYLSPRDIGVMATGLLGDPEGTRPVFEYWAGIFLGRGANQIRNDDDAFLYAARAQVHLFGVPEGQKAESDLAHNEHPRVSMGAGAYTNCDDRGQWNRGFTTDAELRYRGLYASASFVWFKNGPSSGLGDTLGYGSACKGSTALAAHVANGAHVQVQYVLPHAWFPLASQALEVLVRADYVDPASPASGFFGGSRGDAGYAPPTSYADADNSPTRWRLTFGVNWFPTGRQSMRVSVNYQHQREAEHVLVAGTEIVGIANDILWLQLTAGL